MGVFRGYGSGDSAAAPSGQDASQTDYDNTDSGLVADTVQDAIDELEGRVDDLEDADVAIDTRLDALEAAGGGAGSGLAGLVHNVLGTATYDVAGNIAVISTPTPSYSTAIPGSASNLELDDVYAQPFAVVETMTFERMGVRINSSYNPGANDAFIRYLIWEERSPTDRRPGTLVYDSTAFELPDTTVATGKDRYAWHTFSTPFEFEAGKQYWIGAIFSLTSGSYPQIRVGSNETVSMGFHMGNDNAATIHVRLSGATNNPGFEATSGDDSSDYGTGFHIVFAFQT